MSNQYQLTPGALTLADGTMFEGNIVGDVREAEGEVIFITAMSGYQETLTDPSYHRQIVVFTTAHVGNYGTHPDFDQAPPAQAAGAVFHELWLPEVDHWQSVATLPEWLADGRLCALTGVDTRALTIHIRERGAQNGWIGPLGPDPAVARAKARAVVPMDGLDLAKEVTCGHHHVIEPLPGSGPRNRTLKVAVLDFGIKRSIVENLRAQNFRLLMFPGHATARDFLSERPHGLFLSNGPGDPAACDYAVRSTRESLGRVPTFGICLGHQIMALAAEGRTYKLPFGHHGLNHPVSDERTGRVWLTSQNHGFCVDPASLRPEVARPTHWNLNDGTCEGIEWLRTPAFSVQFHPEASPGPHDSMGLFARFRKLMEDWHA